MNKRDQIQVSAVTFRFKGDKAHEIAQALFVQWLDGGMADQFEDYVAEHFDVDLVHDWDSQSMTLEIEAVEASDDDDEDDAEDEEASDEEDA